MRRLLISVLLLAGLLSLSSAQQPDGVDLTIVAINDFHGHLKPPAGGIQVVDPANPAQHIAIPAGGSAYMATLLKQIRAQSRHSIFVAAGDLIGASPFLSALFHDEPTIQSLSMMGLEISAVGNHEFDKGTQELLRLQNGGCHPKDGCQGPSRFEGAKFQYLAASTIDVKTGKPILPPYSVKTFEGIPVAFIGLTLQATASMVTASGIAGLQFRDEAETINALVPELRSRGIEAIVVLIHQGGFPAGDYNECRGLSGPIVDIVRKLNKAVDVVVSGHTHRAYNCVIDGRVVTSADKYGTVVSKIDLKLDPKTRDVASAHAENLIVRDDVYPIDNEQAQLITSYESLAAPLAERVVGSVNVPLTREPTQGGETALGDVIADAQLAATDRDAGAVIAFTNLGSIRADILNGEGGRVRYADLFASQPFDNNLVTLTLTGAQLSRLIEQQWIGARAPNILQVSRGFSYTWDGSRPPGQRLVAGTLKLNGRALAPGVGYRVTVNNFLAQGGDGFSVLKEGTERRLGISEVEALSEYFASHDPVSPGPPQRILRAP